MSLAHPPIPDTTQAAPSAPAQGAPAPPSTFLNALLVIFLALGFTLMQFLIGGVKMVYSLPAYIVLGLAGMAAVGWCRKQNLAKASLWCVLSTLGLVAWLLVRVFYSPVDYLARTDGYMILGSLLVYLLVAVHLVNPRQRFAILWILFILALLHVAVGIVQFKGKENFMLLPWIFRSDYGYRASGFYICPNHLAGLLELTGLLSLSVAVWSRAKTWVRMLAGYVALMALIGIAITGSRGGYISLVAGLIAFGVLSLLLVRRVNRPWFGRVFLAFVLGTAALVGTSIWIMKKSPDLDRRLGQVYDPANMRLHMWRAALDTHELRPWTGVGAGTYLFYGRHFRHETVQGDPQHVHNDYLELLTEYGIVGSALMAIFLALHFGSGFKAIGQIVRTRLAPSGNARSNELAFIIGILAGFAALAVHSVVDFNLHIPANALVAAVLFGILANPRSPTPEETPRGRIDNLPLRLLPVLVGVLLVAVAVPRVLPELFTELARIAVRDQMPEDAVRHAQRGIAWDARNPNLYGYLGDAKHMLALAEKEPAAQAKLEREAAQAFAEGIKYFTADLNLLLKLARTLDNLGHFPQAEYTYRVALKADPNLATVYAHFGHHYFLQRRLIRAEKLYVRAMYFGEREIAPRGLDEILLYRYRAEDEDTGDQFPIEDLPGDDTWEPGEP